MHKFIFSTVLLLLPILTWAADEPIAYVQRSEAVMLLVKHADIPYKTKSNIIDDYPDLIDGQWYTPYMIAGIQHGLVSPDPKTGLVYPNRSVSRAEFLMMMTKAFNLTTGIPYQYADVSSSSKYTSYVGLSWKYKLLQSNNNPTLLQPDAKITHQEAAHAVYLLLAAEPSLQGAYPVVTPSSSSTPTPKPKPIPVIAPKPQPTSTVKYSAPDPVRVYTDASMSQKVKSVMLQIIQTHTSLADQTRNDLLSAINTERAKYKLTPLRSNYYLELAAQRHAKDMNSRGYFSHYSPEGLNYIDRIRSSGYLDTKSETCTCAQQFDLNTAMQTTTHKGADFLVTRKQECSCEPIFSLGENLAKGQLSVQEVMRDWLNSPNHRRNILRPEFEEVGFGLFGDIWVQEFGRLKY